MNDSQLLRYSRHILLPELGIEGQEKLLASRVLILGAGGLGCPVALYLGSAGVGHITVVDHDTIDTTNLQRQIAHQVSRIGQHKAQSIAQSVAAINPAVVVNAITQRADDALLGSLVPAVDLVLDCSDNFATRHAINKACVAHAKPLVSGAAMGFSGQVSTYDCAQQGCPCYACVFPASEPVPETNCATMGVLAPLVGVIGSMQAVEAIKILSGIGASLIGRLWILDGLSMRTNEISISCNPNCGVCSSCAHVN